MKSQGYSKEDLYEESPPARGAWIEIAHKGVFLRRLDRRPPHGGRGLKSCSAVISPLASSVAPRTGGVD